jgi:hypothetical protein
VSVAAGSVASVSYQVRTELAAPRILAAVRAVTTRARLSADIIASLDQVWPVLREQGARTGHNVVIYQPSGAVRRVDTPAGEAAAVTHYAI